MKLLNLHHVMPIHHRVFHFGKAPLCLFICKRHPNLNHKVVWENRNLKSPYSRVYLMHKLYIHWLKSTFVYNSLLGFPYFNNSVRPERLILYFYDRFESTVFYLFFHLASIRIDLSLVNWIEISKRRIKSRFDHNMLLWFLIPAEMSLIFFTLEIMKYSRLLNNKIYHFK